MCIPEFRQASFNFKIMRYLLYISPTAFIINNEDLIITNDYTKATAYEFIGEAMEAASKINKQLGSFIVKIKSYAK